MTVRWEKRLDRKTKAKREILLIDFVYEFPDGSKRRIRKVARASKKRKAEAEERAIIRSLESGTFERKEAINNDVKNDDLELIPTMKEFSKTFIELYAIPNNRQREVDLKRQFLRLYLLPDLGHMRIDEVKTIDVDRVKAKLLASGLSAKTVKNAMGCLSKMFNYAVEIGVIDKTPRVRMPQLPPPDFDFFKFDESERLLDAAKKEKDPTWHAAVLFALRTGARRGEMFELRWSDVNLPSRRVDIRRSHSHGYTTKPKNNRMRTIALTSQTVDVLKDLRERQVRRLDNDLVFVSPDGKRISTSTADRALARICKRAVLREVRWHMLRHTCASHLAMWGKPLKLIQEVLGHSTITMTLRYAHLSPDMKAEAMEILDRPWPGHGNAMATQESTSGVEVAETA
ncbi:MAG: tyrosine-type recombinase/integrase [Deltaproteobacteria bacterium]|nr:tyrosine-type recombinase/integrase [Deltaproteobacteria bacterium]